MSVIINNKEYDINEGIRYLKTIYTTDYEKLPKELKHKEIKDNWDKYEGISKKLYLMSKSEDKETLELAKDILEKENIIAKYIYNNTTPLSSKTILKKIILFKIRQWNNLA